MVIKVGINGFGRIGRIIFRTCTQKSEIQLSAINDPAIDIDYICYLIKFDSTHGKFTGAIAHTENEIIVNGNRIKVFQEKYPPDIPWHLADVQYVIEASGTFTGLEKASGHLSQGVKRVIVTAPSVDVPMIVLGVNDNVLNSDQKVISCASSTLYCLAPIIKVLDDNCGVVEGFITSIHAMTPSLKPLDGLCLRGKHWRDHRSISQNIIPANTGACKALGKILPQVKDKMAGLAFRVPTADVSVLDITIKLNADTTIKEIVKLIEKASTTNFRNIIKISNEQAVSSDFIGDSHSCILDVDSSIQLTPNFFKIICWYENEFSYACRVIDTIFFSEMQLGYLFTTKTTYCRPKLQTPKNAITIPTHLIHINSNDSNKAQLLLKKPMSSHESGTASIARDTKKRNETYKARNDSCDHDRGSFCHSCITFSPKQKNLSGSLKTQERLDIVKKEYSKMLNITEELLNKTQGYKNQLDCTYSKINRNTDFSTESKLLSHEDDEKHNEKNDKQKMSLSIFKNCGDFKFECKNLCNNNCYGEKYCNFSRKDNKYVLKSNDGESVDKDFNETKQIIKRPKLTEFQEHNDKSDTGNTDATLNITPKISNNSEQTSKTANFVKDNSDMNTKLDNSKTNCPKSNVVSPKVVEKPDNELNDSVTCTSKITHKDKMHNNILQVQSKLSDANTRFNQNSECKPSINEENAEKEKNVPKYFDRKRYNVRIIDEELKKRNITLVSSNTNLERLIIANSEPPGVTSKATLGDQAKNTNPCKKAHSFAYGCDSPDTVTTISNGDKARVQQDLYDKLDSASESDSNSSFQINGRKSQVLHMSDLTNSLEDVSRLDKICKIIEISDELSDQLFSRLGNDYSSLRDKKWSFKDLCEKIKLDEFCNNLFGKTTN